MLLIDQFAHFQFYKQSQLRPAFYLQPRQRQYGGGGDGVESGGL